MTDERYKKIGPFSVDRRKVWKLEHYTVLFLFLVIAIVLVYLVPDKIEALVAFAIALVKQLDIYRTGEWKEGIRKAIKTHEEKYHGAVKSDD